MNKDKYDKKIETTVRALLDLEEAILDVQSEFILEISGFGESVDTQIIDENINEFNAKEEEIIELEKMIVSEFNNMFPQIKKIRDI
ncbi:MAG: hypothetical protein KAU62_09925 [Candidatus Heimdallarchaeota archaeon]|nr:hypothetical protein [Candidatus Heimdallarchaeota archaeon]MCK4611460.1 hypothetical protein [Candidatus Heimdallarchaeota archaeon]